MLLLSGLLWTLAVPARPMLVDSFDPANTDGIRQANGSATRSIPIDAFTHLSVLLSIILGLAITQVLKGYRGLIQSRHTVKTYVPTIVWSVLLLVIFTQSWWTMFALREHRAWTFAEFAVVLTQTVVQYLMAALVLPDLSAGEEVDLRRHYFDQQRWFFGFAVLAVVISIVKELMIEGHLPDRINLAFHLGFMVIWALAAFVHKGWYHLMLCWLTSLTFAAYIFTLFTRLD